MKLGVFICKNIAILLLLLILATICHSLIRLSKIVATFVSNDFSLDA